MTKPIRTDRIAEDQVANLCRLKGGIVTPVKEDENGWDLMVEFPPAVESAFADQDPPLRRCLIQVKSTQSRRPYTKVKLSNALTLAKDPLPCFTILLTYPRPDQFEAAYLQHVWGSNMMDALFKARKAQAEGKLLHKQTLPISFAAVDRHDGDVISALLRAIDDVGPGYAEKKRQLSEAMGYENGWGELNFTLADDHTVKDLDDLMLGLRPDLPITAVSITERRFNIPGPVQNADSGRLSVVEHPPEKCVLTMTHGDDPEELVWSGQVFKGLDFLPSKERRVRIVAGPLTVMLGGDGSVKANWTAPRDAPRQLDELIRDVRFRSWMDGSKVFLTVWRERGEFKPIGLTFDDDEGDEIWPQLLAAVKAIARVVPAERRPLDLRVSLNALVDRIEHHRMFAQLSGPDRHAMRIDTDDPAEIGFEGVTHIVLPWAIPLGDYFLVAVVERAVSRVTRTDRKVYFDTSDGRVLRGTSIRASAATDELLAAEVRWANDRARRSGRKVLSFHPTGDGSGDLELWTGDDPDE